MKYRTAQISDLVEHPANPRQGDVGAIVTSIEQNGVYRPLVVQASTMRVLAGNHTLKAMRALGHKKASIVEVDVDDETATRILLVDNRSSDLASYDDPALLELLVALAEADQLLGTGYEPDDVDQMLADLANEQHQDHGTLTERFLVPPFSVLDARQGYWQERKRKWLALGIRSELGRGANLLNLSDAMLAVQAGQGYPKKAKDLAPEHDPAYAGGTSIFDPVLCEIAYRWFAPAGGAVLDPFAGGSVRGIVAATLGLYYTGIDLAGAQLESNREQWSSIVSDRPAPIWIEGDSRQTLQDDELGREFDLVFSCPPYADLEKYSDDPADLSSMSYDAFLEAYRDIIRGALSRLRDDRFAVWVVGEVRDPRGAYRGLVPDTIRAFQDAGAQLYNEAILVTSVGSLALRAARFFEGSRKLGKTHQNVLIFVKGDPARAHAALGAVEVPTEAFESVPVEPDVVKKP